MTDSTHGPDRHPTRKGVVRAGLWGAEVVLATAGILCLVAYAGACARASHTQQNQSEAFDQALRAQLERETPNRGEWSSARVSKYEETLDQPVDALARLEIPEADVSVMVLPGTDDTTLDRAVGHIEGTALPGKGGNLGIAGHRDGYFRGLRHLEAGDAITLTSFEGTAHYEVERIDIVDPERVDVLAPTQDATLTLVTCYPFYHVGSAPERYIVRARQVGFESWSTRSASSVY